MIFQDRVDAGTKLYKLLVDFKNKDIEIIGIPRGGVIIADIVSQMLGTEMNIVFTKKIPAPENKEFAIGAIAQDRTLFLDNKIIDELSVNEEYLSDTIEKTYESINLQIEEYNYCFDLNRVKNKTIIIIDDGIATGATVNAIILSLKKYKPKKIIIATPVCSQQTFNALNKIVDKIFSIITPLDMNSVGEYYIKFDQIDDNEITELVKKSSNLIS